MSNAKELNSGQLMDRILDALGKKEPLSIISVGQTEAFVMAQYTIYSEDVFMKHPESRKANKNEKLRGIHFPNVKARDEAVEATRNADIIGYNTIFESYKELAEKVFNAYDIKPEFIFEANIRRVIIFSQKGKFKEMLRGRKILLIGSQAKNARGALIKKWQNKLGFKIVDTIPIYHYEEIPQVKEEIARNDFDLCLLGAGINAVILAPYIARTLGKVAFDIGFGMESLITDQIVAGTGTRNIGIETLLKI
jgi:hypothetical protein